ncbi:hypothetical protein DN730_05130 [Marinomonas piezotolerans]|uniref:Uncharacterized protein n=1 Tax=Marinomonas piezotolerans TaxID=2213058 RepID=A0A370UB33_9GAMM|nr:hypothetical protein DN730_05130 [Marinomonas piezotolerans]
MAWIRQPANIEADWLRFVGLKSDLQAGSGAGMRRVRCKNSLGIMTSNLTDLFKTMPTYLG